MHSTLPIWYHHYLLRSCFLNIVHHTNECLILSFRPTAINNVQSCGSIDQIMTCDQTWSQTVYMLVHQLMKTCTLFHPQKRSCKVTPHLVGCLVIDWTCLRIPPTDIELLLSSLTQPDMLTSAPLSNSSFTSSMPRLHDAHIRGVSPLCKDKCMLQRILAHPSPKCQIIFNTQPHLSITICYRGRTLNILNITV